MASADSEKTMSHLEVMESFGITEMDLDRTEVEIE